jgi:RecA-family ATPase
MPEQNECDLNNAPLSEIQRQLDLSGNIAPSPPSDHIEHVNMATVQPQTVNFLWYPYIPDGKLTILEGNPGSGKSWLALAISTAVSKGAGLPGVYATAPGRVFLASAEDGLADTIRPRLDTMGADVSQIEAAKELFTLDNLGIARLENTIKEFQPSLLIIDPLVWCI